MTNLQRLHLKISELITEEEEEYNKSIIQESKVEIDFKKLQLIIEIDKFVTDFRKKHKKLNNLMNSSEFDKCLNQFVSLMDMSCNQEEMSYLTLKFQSLYALAQLVSYFSHLKR